MRSIIVIGIGLLLAAQVQPKQSAERDQSPGEALPSDGSAQEQEAASPVCCEDPKVKTAETLVKEPRYQLLFYGASWCVPCQQTIAAIEGHGIEHSLDGTKPVWHIDAERWPKSANDYGVRSYPTLILTVVKGDRREIVRRHVGGLNEAGIEMQFPELFSFPKAENKSEPVRTCLCGCDGHKRGCCLCLKEIEAGIRTKPCGCSKKLSSRHYMDANGNPIGGTGEYVKTKDLQ